MNVPSPSPLSSLSPPPSGRARHGSMLWVGCVLLCILGAGCATHDGLREDSLTVELPENFTQPTPAEPTTSSRAERWWLAFQDDALNAHIDTALRDGLELQQARARIVQADAVGVQQGALSMPQLNATISASRSRTVFLGIPGAGGAFTQNQYDLSLSASYEVDLWGRVGSLEDAAKLDSAASREDLRTAAVSVSARVVDTWFSIIELRERVALLDTQVSLSQEYLELVRLRFAQGQTSALEVIQQEQQLETLQSNRPLLSAQLQQLEFQFSILLGQTPGRRSFAQTSKLPPLPPTPERGIPSDLLKHRPDLRSAWLRIQAVDKRVAAAVSDQYPALRLTGSVGYRNVELKDIFDNFIWSLGGSLVAPLLDGTRREAEVVRQKAVLDERLHAYGQTLLGAVQEVETALVQERAQREQLRILEKRLDLARKTLDQARTSYAKAGGSYLNVLNALHTLQQLEQTRITTQRQLLSSRVQLHRALGGQWTQDLERTASKPSKPSTTQPTHTTLAHKEDITP